MKILFTGAFRFPEGDAAAYRVMGLAELVKYCHHEEKVEINFAGWEASYNGSIEYEYTGHVCFSQDEFRRNSKNVFSRIWGFIFRGRNTLEWLNDNNRYDVIVAYNPPVFFCIGLLLFARRKNRKLILDTTEWYQGAHLPGGKFGIASLENWLRMRVAYHFFRNKICISHFLYNNFNSAKNRIIIPPLILGGNTQSSRANYDLEIRFAYAGQPGKKDLLIPFIESLPVMQQNLKRKIILEIAGVTISDIDKLLREANLSIEKYRPYLVCHGRISKSEVCRLYARSHFSVLLRSRERYAYAGFPTKAIESWQNGCPIIGNMIGDVQLYAKNLINSIYWDGANSNMLIESLQLIGEGGGHDIMVKNSEETAQTFFSPSSFSEEFALFLEKL